jgi:DNA polymerase III delta' subunit
MAKIMWHGLAGQQRIKDTLSGIFETGQMGHAYLFCGNSGIGKFQAALNLGMALLCTNRENVPCLECESCRKILKHAHPDFHMALPVKLDPEHRSESKLSDKGWEYLHGKCLERIEKPYETDEADELAEIPVEWIREINHAIIRGSVESNRNVAVICDAESLNRSSANAMLKTLEEPPAGTVIILTAKRPHAVLRTIVSRCQPVRFGRLSEEQISAALAVRYELKPDNDRIAAAASGADGSLGQAIQLMELKVENLRGLADRLISLAAGTDFLAAAAGIEELFEEIPGGSKNAGAVEKVLMYVLHAVRDSLLSGTGAPEKYINNNRPAVFKGVLGPKQAQAAEKTCRQAISAIHAHGNMQILLAAWMLSMTELLHE